MHSDSLRVHGRTVHSFVVWYHSFNMAMLVFHCYASPWSPLIGQYLSWACIYICICMCLNNDFHMNFVILSLYTIQICHDYASQLICENLQNALDRVYDNILLGIFVWYAAANIFRHLGYVIVITMRKKKCQLIFNFTIVSCRFIWLWEEFRHVFHHPWCKWPQQQDSAIHHCIHHSMCHHYWLLYKNFLGRSWVSYLHSLST